ncbi:MAG: hypothetical protein H6863_03470 [Rhodospirillales bacterium]|nr:hypothetical protein [Rhodospirillales bacterium]
MAKAKINNPTAALRVARERAHLKPVLKAEPEGNVRTRSTSGLIRQRSAS